jgi:hypothetical protein
METNTKTEARHLYRHSDTYLTFCGLNQSPRVEHLEGCKGYPCTCTIYVDCEGCKTGEARRRQAQAEAAQRASQARREREAAIPSDFEIYD